MFTLRSWSRPSGWQEDLNDPKVRLVESDEDVSLYETGHISGALKIDWGGDPNDPLLRDYVGGRSFSD